MLVRESQSIVQQPHEIELLERHQSGIAKILTILEDDPETAENLVKLEELSRDWVNGDHWASKSHQRLTAEQRTALGKVFNEMGLMDAVMTSKDQYDHVVILGGTTRGNVRFASFVKQLLDSDSLHTDNSIDLLAGQRLREDRETPQLVNVLEDIDERGIVDEWLLKERSKLGEGWDMPFATETEVARLALMSVFGPLQQDYASIHLGLQPKSDQVPARNIAWRQYATDEGQQLKLVNAAAVARPYGKPRHTTSSSIAEWLDYIRPAKDSNILIINSNPHIPRTGSDVKRVLTDAGRTDLSVEVAGPEAVSYTPSEVFLGEIGRIIHNAAKKS